ncbi:hypothetical protein OAB17_05300 [Flavobacteriaceae bacterium]|jgi:hypothetical protein|nr:hypothetical protein [Flavobacteriaceae bacterium]MDB9781323.1 hypothetical protein [Flavobacteriaceae bacterium]MDB9798842.1 hypothetical protein [Flavobacteriaceae bacterium]
MIQSRHCDLCKHEKRSLKNGLTCGLTDKRPDFKKTCSSFKLANEARQDYETIINEFENIRGKKIATHSKFYMLILIGFIIILFGNLFLKEVPNLNIRYYKLVYFVYSFGIILITVAFSILNKHRRDFKNIEYEKSKIEEILEQYKMKLK